MSRIVVLCATVRDRRELARRRLDGGPDGRDYGHGVFMFHEYGTTALESLITTEPDFLAIADPEGEIERIVDACRSFRADGVISTDDYPGSILASIVAERLGLPGVPPAASLLCQHKYHARCLQRLAVPEATPEFALADPRLLWPAAFPVFVKPVKSFFSIGAQPVLERGAFEPAVRRASLPQSFFDPFERLMRRHSALPVTGHVLIESLLEGSQCTVEGWMSRGDVHILGVVDTLMYPGTSSFLRFDYPSRLPAAVQARMADIARRLVAAIGYGEGLFNIEMMYDEQSDSIQIVEINPRMSSQFADLFEKVDGINTYALLLDLATGRQPLLPAAREGVHGCASSLALRSFVNLRTRSVPSAVDLAAVRSAFPDVRVEVLTRPGRTLGQELQDGHSYRYALINAGGNDEADLDARLRSCIARLPFRFEPTGRRPRGAAAVPRAAAIRTIRRAADRCPVPDAGVPPPPP